MGLLEAADMGGVITVGPSVTVLSGLRGPEIHTPRNGHRRVGVAGGKAECRQRSAERIDIVDWFFHFERRLFRA